MSILSKIKNLSSKFKIPTAEKELGLFAGVKETGQRSDSLSPFSNVFNRGQGMSIFSIAGIGITASIFGDHRFKGGFSNIQDAIDWVNSGGGGQVNVPAGTYTITSDITLYSNVYLKGEDDDRTIFDFNNGDYQIVATGTAGSHLYNIRISDIKIHQVDPANKAAAVDFTYVDDSQITNCFFNDIYDSGNDLGSPISLDNCTRISIRRNRFVETGELMEVSNSSFIWIKDNYFKNNSSNPLTIYGTSDNCFIINNVFDAVDASGAITIANSSAIVTGNAFKGVTVNAIYLNGATFTTVSGNRINGTGTNAIKLSGASRCSVVGNTINGGHSGAAIILGSNSDDNVISGNIATAADRGVHIDNADCDDNIVTSNNLSGNTTAGLTDSGTGTTSGNNET